MTPEQEAFYVALNVNDTDTDEEKHVKEAVNTIKGLQGDHGYQHTYRAELAYTTWVVAYTAQTLTPYPEEAPENIQDKWRWEARARFKEIYRGLYTN